MRRTLGKVAALSAGVLALVWFAVGQAQAQSPTASATRDCADFDTQEEAQAFYDQHKNDDPNNPDPYDLDTDGDGKACEGLPSSAGSPAPTASAGAQTAVPTPTPTATPAGPLPNNGAETGVLALSGLTFLEAGYGLTLASRRLGIRRRAIPLYLLRKFVSAARTGEGHVEIGDDLYLVHRSVLENAPLVVPEDEEDAEDSPFVQEAPYVEQIALERVDNPDPSVANLYAALARPDARRKKKR
jgi:hypothetical protein